MMAGPGVIEQNTSLQSLNLREIISVSEALRRWQRVFRMSKHCNRSIIYECELSIDPAAAGGLSKEFMKVTILIAFFRIGEGSQELRFWVMEPIYFPLKARNRAFSK
jgi:hypothetical protein